MKHLTVTFIKVEDQHVFWRKLGPPPFFTSLLSGQKDFPWPLEWVRASASDLNEHGN